ncbi:MAG: hypothetical protein A2845_05665 [Candidatus Lloydbacteria bacterium RIFCSPHIGHO2_01_FULL_49_22]|uniref:Uncharacterized protein n=1 Tax=Candidatus Lloydbacteria bacterium RIFCSPHIGHO2_01_FULL_49_22 TaxID=1798658 RepID=A0A1G2CVU3_9BACT|nr:MAG: hypothetical protein A2845_05665 [Candidatus Lloydbacteria bacterium RIFCSPHIGHO2_01_FULL_49_22]OGZ09826.1 MAG: hypothetical protein A3C14_00350 [Candidatus Lloydbacteria bacterium RIFCSPHIGHO2_02_FULL_50_18]
MLYHSKAKLEKLKKKRIAARYDMSGRPTPEERARRLLHAEPIWGPILRECLAIADEKERSKKSTSGFAGAWVMQALRAKGITPPNNLRTPACLGILKLVATTRSGNRAYYHIPDPKGLARALKSSTR